MSALLGEMPSAECGNRIHYPSLPWNRKSILILTRRYWKHWDSGITRDSKRVFGNSEQHLRKCQRIISKSTHSISWPYYIFLPSHWLAIWRIFRRIPLSEEKYPNCNPAWKQVLLIIDFQGNTRKGSSTSLSAKNTWKPALCAGFIAFWGMPKSSQLA